MKHLGYLLKGLLFLVIIVGVICGAILLVHGAFNYSPTIFITTIAGSILIGICHSIGQELS